MVNGFIMTFFLITPHKILFLIIVLLAFQASSIGIEEDLYFILKNVVAFFTFILFLFCFKKSFKYVKRIFLLKLHFLCAIFLIFILFFLKLFDFNINFGISRDILISFFIVIIGVCLEFDSKFFLNLSLTYVVCFSLSSLSIVLSHASGFVILDQYLSVPKNQIAFAYSTALITSIYFGFIVKNRYRFIFYSSSVILFASLLVLRGRASLLAAFISTVILIIFYIKNYKNKIIFIFFIILIIFLFYGQIYKSIFLNYNVSDIDSVSAGRVVGYIEGLDYIKNNPLSGEMGNVKYFDINVHNYLLNSIITYGFILSIFPITLYVTYLIFLMKFIIKNNYGIFEIGPFVMIAPIVVSFFEYTYPFSPVSSIFFSFVCFGQFLRKYSYGRSENIKYF